MSGFVLSPEGMSGVELCLGGGALTGLIVVSGYLYKALGIGASLREWRQDLYTRGLARKRRRAADAQISQATAELEKMHEEMAMGIQPPPGKYMDAVRKQYPQ